jgi:hypothetical protein
MVKGLGCRVYSTGLRSQSSGFMVWGLGNLVFRVLGFRFLV